MPRLYERHIETMEQLRDEMETLQFDRIDDVLNRIRDERTTILRQGTKTRQLVDLMKTIRRHYNRLQTERANWLRLANQILAPPNEHGAEDDDLEDITTDEDSIDLSELTELSISPPPPSPRSNGNDNDGRNDDNDGQW